MSPDKEFNEYTTELGIKYGEEIAGVYWNDAIKVVLSIALSDKRNLPNLGYKDKKIVPLKEYIGKWVKSYFKGYSSRPSVKIGNPSGTAPDVIIGYILKEKLPHLKDETVTQVANGHSLMMSIENLVGALLEEYLAVKLEQDGWYCCWGNTMDAIDFCKSDGSLLQVKTSDNSENSSSSRVRNNTTIEVWQRRNSKKENSYYWDDLNELLGRKGGDDELSEAGFRYFIAQVIAKNPGCLYIPDDHILRQTQ